MLGTLIKAQFAALMASMFRGSKSKKKKGVITKILIALLVIYIVVVFIGLFSITFLSIAEPLATMGLGWFYFAMAGIMAFSISFIMSVFMAQQLLFSAKDNDLLLSMPIPTAYILGSRMLSLLLMDYAISLFVMLPAGIIWFANVSASAVSIVNFIIVFLLLPLLTMAFTCFFGWLLALITDRVRNKTTVTLVLSLLFLGVYFYLMSTLNSQLQTIVANSAIIAESVKGAVYPAYALGMAVSAGAWGHLLGFAACCIIPFAAVYAVLSGNFLSIAASKRGVAKIKYEEQSLKVGTAASALLSKELRRFANNGMYILNAALGSIMTIAAAVAVFIWRDSILLFGSMLPSEFFSGLAVAALCALCTTDVISAPTVSLEGQSLWIVKSMPVSTLTILMAKVNLHLVVALPPTIIASICVIIALPFTLIDAVFILVLPVLVTAFCALFGVVMNLHHPKLDYINETAVVKQSASVMISMFGGMGLVFGAAALYGFVLSDMLAMSVYLGILTVLLVAACYIMYRWLAGTGSRKFEAL